MKELWSNIVNNLSFIGMCLLVIAALGVVARLVELKLPQLRKVSVARRVSIIGICSALAAVLHMLDFPLPFLAPSFYKLDFSEVPVLLAGFFLGPSAAVACEGIKILLKLLLKGTSTAFVGDFANFVVGCCFVLPAVVFYHIRKTKVGAIIGLIIGTLTLTVLGSAFNAVYLLPKFSELFHMPLDQIIGMGASIHPAISGVSSFVFLCVAPLNLVKGAVVSLLTMLLYKHVAAPLFQIKK
ncbi:MAG: ECF transporter S component [Faecousia sp.]